MCRRFVGAHSRRQLDYTYTWRRKCHHRQYADRDSFARYVHIRYSWVRMPSIEFGWRVFEYDFQGTSNNSGDTENKCRHSMSTENVFGTTAYSIYTQLVSSSCIKETHSMRLCADKRSQMEFRDQLVCIEYVTDISCDCECVRGLTGSQTYCCCGSRSIRSQLAVSTSSNIASMCARLCARASTEESTHRFNEMNRSRLARDFLFARHSPAAQYELSYPLDVIIIVLAGIVIVNFDTVRTARFLRNMKTSSRMQHLVHNAIVHHCRLCGCRTCMSSCAHVLSTDDHWLFFEIRCAS